MTTPRLSAFLSILLTSAVALLVLAFSIKPIGAQAPARQLTVERIYSAPSLSGEVLRGTSWSPDGKLLAYLGRDAASGEQEVWAADAATGRRSVLVDAAHLRQVLLPPASRGQTTGLGRLAPARFLWTPNSQALLFISAEELFWYDLPSKTSKRLIGGPEGSAARDATIDDAKISPDGRRVSFLRHHEIWMVSTATGEVKQLTHGGSDELRDGELDWVYPEELHLDTAYWWSPDSSRIAFLQLDERSVTKYPLVDYLSPQGETTEEPYPVAGSSNPVARVGVVDVDAGETHWIDTGADNDEDKTVLLARVNWLRDSNHVAIERLNRVQNHLDLLIADTATGKAHPVLTENDPYWININDDLYFFADGQRFLWASERSGFRHLYLYDLAGKQLAQLTRGDWEVEDIARVDERGGGGVYFTSTEKSPIERQLYRVPLAGGEPVQITRAPGTHEIEMAGDGGHFLDTYSTALHPPRQILSRVDGGAVATLADNEVQELADYHLQPVEFLHVPGAAGEQLDGEMIKPPGFDPTRKYPVLVYVYGGPEFQVVQDQWGYSTLLWNELMAQRGFIIFAVDNRGAGGHGHRFETAIYHHFGQAELADQLAAVDWLSRQPFVDGGRLGIWGWSYGGTMACLAMLRGGSTFKAGFAGAPVTDWRLYDTIYTERYMGTPQENASGYRDSSPVNYAAGLRGKLLIAHATGDDNVHFGNTVELAEKLVEAQKYAEIQIYAGRGHGISDAPARMHIFNRMTQFFVENLGK